MFKFNKKNGNRMVPVHRNFSCFLYSITLGVCLYLNCFLTSYFKYMEPVDKNCCYLSLFSFQFLKHHFFVFIKYVWLRLKYLRLWLILLVCEYYEDKFPTSFSLIVGQNCLYRFASALGGLAANDIIQRATDRLETVNSECIHVYGRVLCLF